MSDSKIEGRRPNGQYIKGYHSPGQFKPGERISPDTEFQSGHVPDNKLPCNSVTLRQRRFDKVRAWVKTAEPNTWELRAVVVWKEAGGVIPEGFLLHHIDEDTLNDDLSNLALIARSAHPKLHRLTFSRIQSGQVVPIKTIICTDCNVEFQGKYQRKVSLCDDCKRRHHRVSALRYKQRIRAEG